MISSYEKYIMSLLQTAQIPFEREKQFADCYNGYYRFDFFLPELNVVLEVNGAQHYYYSKHFYKHKSDFTKAQERDRRKISYCLANNIKIYEIPYWEIDNIFSIKDLFSEKFLALTKFHNDIVWHQQKSKNHN